MMQTFYQYLLSEAPTPPPSGGSSPASPPGASKPPSGGAPPPMGGGGLSAPPMGLGGPPVGLGGPGPAPLGGPPMGDPQAQNPAATGVQIQKLKSSNVWEALEKSLKTKKSRQEDKNSI